MVTPETIVTTPETTVKLAALGGEGEITWKAQRGELSAITGAEVEWTALSNTGSFNIIATDSTSAMAVISVDVVSEGLRIVPSSIHVEPRHVARLQAALGKGPYRWYIESGDGDIAYDEEDSEEATYTAPQVKGAYDVRVVDAAGNEATAKIYVYTRGITVSPANLYVANGEKGAMYAGADSKVDDIEMQTAITDYLQGDAWLTPDVMFRLIEAYTGD